MAQAQDDKTILTEPDERIMEQLRRAQFVLHSKDALLKNAFMQSLDKYVLDGLQAMLKQLDGIETRHHGTTRRIKAIHAEAKLRAPHGARGEALAVPQDKAGNVVHGNFRKEAMK